LRSFFKLGSGLAVGGCLFLFVSTSAAAYFDTGNEVYERCIAPDNSSKHQTCLTTASAYFDMMRALGYSCNGDKVTRRQVADVFVKFLRENPTGLVEQQKARKSAVDSPRAKRATQAMHVDTVRHSRAEAS
jgi:hypothetical protein